MRISQSNKPELLDSLDKSSVEINSLSDLDPLIEQMGNKKVVLLGEASHGTHEYYSWRARITKRLLEEKDFDFVAVEGDWPDCYRINRFVKNYKDAPDEAREVLEGFTRWPTWMWANWEMMAFNQWLHDYNFPLKMDERKGFYGLDVYSLWESLEAIIDYLEKTDPEALEKAKKAFACFEPYNDGEGQSYARATRMVGADCEDEVVELLSEIRRKVPQFNADPEAALNAEQNAEVTVNAENYYRAMVQSGPDSWNIRDQHMAETLDRLLNHHGANAKGIVWEHNTHIGDARYTDMSDAGMVNIGQLAREKYGEENCYLLGFGSYRGSVIAGSRWGAEMEEMNVPTAPKGSWEQMLHEMGRENQVVFVNELRKKKPFHNPFDHRAIGVVYRPGFEARGNYVPSVMSHRYDAFQFIDISKALHPLKIQPQGDQTPETYPWGI